jgi:hypothetical protein
MELMATSEAMTVEKTTLNLTTQGLSLETALFPFLFLHGHEVYDGKIPFNDYIKYKMSAFILHIVQAIFALYV